MFTLHPTTEIAGLTELRAESTLTREDYRRLVPELAALLQPGEHRAFLVVLDQFHGWEPAALLDEVRFDAKFRDQIGPVAIVGPEAWERWGAQLSRLILTSPVRAFAARREALRWLQEQLAGDTDRS